MTQAQFDVVTVLAFLGLFALEVVRWRQAGPGQQSKVRAVLPGLLSVLCAANLVDDLASSASRRPVLGVLAAPMVVLAALVLGLVGYTAYQFVRTRAHQPRA